MHVCIMRVLHQCLFNDVVLCGSLHGVVVYYNGVETVSNIFFPLYSIFTLFFPPPLQYFFSGKVSHIQISAFLSILSLLATPGVILAGRSLHCPLKSQCGKSGQFSTIKIGFYLHYFPHLLSVCFCTCFP